MLLVDEGIRREFSAADMLTLPNLLVGGRGRNTVATHSLESSWDPRLIAAFRAIDTCCRIVLHLVAVYRHKPILLVLVILVIVPVGNLTAMDTVAI